MQKRVCLLLYYNIARSFDYQGGKPRVNKGKDIRNGHLIFVCAVTIAYDLIRMIV